MNTTNLGIMIDCSRNAVPNLSALKKFIDITSKMGYNSIQLYTEDTFEVENEPLFGFMRGRYSFDEIKEIDEYASSKGVELIPCIQTLAHLGAIMRWSKYQKIRDCNDILLIDDEGTYELIENFFITISKTFKSRKVNIGMDEAHMVGLGAYLDKHGFNNRFELLLKHLNRVVQIAVKYGFKPYMWSDMFFRLVNNGGYYGSKIKFSQEVLSKVPKEVTLVYWDYYSIDQKHYDDMIESHKYFNNNDIAFAGGAWCWAGFAPHNEFSILTTDAAVKSCVKYGVNEIWMTLWGDDGAECSIFAMLPSLMYAADLANGVTDLNVIKTHFKEIVGVEFDDFLKLDLPNHLREKKQVVGVPSDIQYYYNLVNTPCKYMFFADCFQGLFDRTVTQGDGKVYGEIAQKLSKHAVGEWGYLFDYEAKLCNALEIKYELGVTTKKLYDKKDKKALINLVNDSYIPLISRIEEFYDSYSNRWYKENKAFGLEVQDIRIGGVLQRLKTCIKRLLDFANGVIEKIDELEEYANCNMFTDDDYAPGARGEVPGEPIYYNLWSKIVSTSVL
ncbi:MAG: beta-N-acetylhexosaminidase [Clostridia bacterium]|nr:beta-N-acetylhexosaminidase [Clostridia bacterium]